MLCIISCLIFSNIWGNSRIFFIVIVPSNPIVSENISILCQDFFVLYLFQYMVHLIRSNQPSGRDALRELLHHYDIEYLLYLPSEIVFLHWLKPFILVSVNKSVLFLRVNELLPKIFLHFHYSNPKLNLLVYMLLEELQFVILNPEFKNAPLKTA